MCAYARERERARERARAREGERERERVCVRACVCSREARKRRQERRTKPTEATNCFRLILFGEENVKRKLVNKFVANSISSEMKQKKVIRTLVHGCKWDKRS